MGQYFLLKRTEDDNNAAEAENLPDLSGWIGRYTFSEEKADIKSKRWFQKDDAVEFESIEVTREYEINIIKDDIGKFYADVPFSLFYRRYT